METTDGRMGLMTSFDGRTRYAVAYDRPTSNDKAAVIHLGDFGALIDTASLVKQLNDEGKQNVRIRSRLVSDYVDSA